MNRYRITGQSYTSSQRIAKSFEAMSQCEAIRNACRELEEAGFYVVDCVREK